MNPKTKKMRIIFIVIAVLFVLIFTTLLLLLQKKGTQLSASDTTLTNIQSLDITRDQSGNAKALFFFTGSNIAQLNPDNLSNGGSRAVLKEYPYTNVEAIRYHPEKSMLLVRVDPGYLRYMPGMESTSADEQLTAWFLQTKTSGPRLLDFKKPILDLQFSGENIIVLTYGEDTNQLNLYNPQTNVLKTLQNTNSNKIIGTFKDTIYTRSSSGDVSIIHSSGKLLETLQTKGKAYLDPRNGALVIENNKKVDIKLNKDRWSINLDHPNYFINDGLIIETDSKSNPTILRVYDIKLKSWTVSYKVANEYGNKETINSIHVLQTKPFTAVVINANYSAFLLSSDNNLIKSVSPFKFPEQKTIERSDFVYDYTIGNNTAIIITDKPADATLTLVSEFCNCNPNSIQKDWRKNATDDDHTHDEDFTGDGAPPEELGL